MNTPTRDPHTEPFCTAELLTTPVLQDIYLVLARAQTPLTLADIAVATRLPAQEVAHHLSTLLAHDPYGQAYFGLVNCSSNAGELRTPSGALRGYNDHGGSINNTYLPFANAREVVFS